MLSTTLRRVEEANLRLLLLDTWYDVDDGASLVDNGYVGLGGGLSRLANVMGTAGSKPAVWQPGRWNFP